MIGGVLGMKYRVERRRQPVGMVYGIGYVVADVFRAAIVLIAELGV